MTSPSVEYLLEDEKPRAGERLTVRFKLLMKSTRKPINDLQDARYLAFLLPGIWQKRGDAKSIGKGIYEFEVTIRDPGHYWILVEVKSLNVRFKDLPPHKFDVVSP